MRETWARAYIGLGSNLGERRRNMARALAMLERFGHVKIAKVSSLYETEPVGYTEQGLFLNAVAEIACDLPPEGLLSLCRDIEARLGRERSVRWGPRTIDVDILLFYLDSHTDAKRSRGEAGTWRDSCKTHLRMQAVSLADLTIPHPRMWERGFVMIPLAEIEPDLATPGGHAVRDAWHEPRMWEGLRLFAAGRWWLEDGNEHAGWQVHRFTEVDSTNDSAASLAERGAPEGTCVIAETQRAGRGRLGRTWHSPAGGLWLSVVLRPKLPAHDFNKLSIVAGVAVTQAVREVMGMPAMMKWPNDVLVAGKKVSGVLIDSRWQGGSADFVVAGIGINVAIDLSMLPSGVRETASTLLAPREPPAHAVREATTVVLLRRLESLYSEFLSGRFLGILEKAKLYSDTLGREVVVVGPEMSIQGVAVDIDSSAALVVKTPSGCVRVVSGEVSVRGAGSR